MPSTIAIPRPAADEHAPFYAGYIAAVPGDDAMAPLATQLDDTLRLVRGLSDARALHRYAADKWSVKQVLVHVSDAERVFAYRALRFARADATPLPGFDEHAWAAAAGADRRPLGDLVEELRAVRAASLALYRSLDEAEIERRGEANGWPVSVRALAWITAGHERHHARILRERYGLGG